MNADGVGRKTSPCLLEDGTMGFAYWLNLRIGMHIDAVQGIRSLQSLQYWWSRSRSDDGNQFRCQEPWTVNIGDTIIFVGGCLVEPSVCAGGLGSALADFGGLSSLGTLTLIIKGIEGLIVGLMVYPGVRKGLGVRRTLAGLAVAGLWMVLAIFSPHYHLCSSPWWLQPVVAMSGSGGQYCLGNPADSNPVTSVDPL